MKKAKKRGRYANFDWVDGQHDFRDCVEQGYVDYPARKRRGGKVFYFNFSLAKEMGLIPRNHSHQMNAKLEKKLLDVFGIEIVNEYDIIHGANLKGRDLTPNLYMATQYLQLQHPDKRGVTSGDGRSIWNGMVTAKGKSWDITSCGTGVTRFSPATAIERKLFKTGNKVSSYGCGRSDLVDGVAESLMSEIFHQNGIPTTRILAIISYPDKSSINVRAYTNMLRPAHLFHHLKQGNVESLQGAMDYYIRRQVKNREWKRTRKVKKYREFLDYVTQQFAYMSALFETEYIFCWLDWDGDNILLDGAIIDYGSIRQFGLYHHQYRYADADRMSTTIPEQKRKAKLIVQTFAQLVDFVKTGKRKKLQSYKNHRAVRMFDEMFEEYKDLMLLEKMGLKQSEIKKFLKSKSNIKLIRKFRNVYSLLEKVTSTRGEYKVSDGVTTDAVFCLRDVLRELPHLYAKALQPIDEEVFVQIMASAYAKSQDLKITPTRRQQIKQFQSAYLKIIEAISGRGDKAVSLQMTKVARQAALINRYERVTGDSILHISNYLIRSAKKMNSKSFHEAIERFVESQVLVRGRSGAKSLENVRNKNVSKIFSAMRAKVKDHREGL